MFFMNKSISNLIYWCCMWSTRTIWNCYIVSHHHPDLLLLAIPCFLPLWTCLSELLPLGRFCNFWSLLCIFTRIIGCPLLVAPVTCPLNILVGKLKSPTFGVICSPMRIIYILMTSTNLLSILEIHLQRDCRMIYLVLPIVEPLQVSVEQ